MTEFIYRCVNEDVVFVKDERVKIRVSFPSYKLFYEEGCEDLILGRSNDRMGEQAEKRDQERRRTHWLD